MSGARKDGEKGHLSQRTVKHLVDTLRTICRWAVRMGILVRNPVDAIESPKVDRREMRALDPAGVAELLRAVSGGELEAPVAVAVGTGLRRGELLGLRWPDVDFEGGRLTVRRSVETVNGITRAKPPKTLVWYAGAGVGGRSQDRLDSARSLHDCDDCKHVRPRDRRARA